MPAETTSITDLKLRLSAAIRTAVQVRHTAVIGLRGSQHWHVRSDAAGQSVHEAIPHHRVGAGRAWRDLRPVVSVITGRDQRTDARDRADDTEYGLAA